MNTSVPEDQNQSASSGKHLLLTQILTAFLFITLPLIGFIAGLKLAPRFNPPSASTPSISDVTLPTGQLDIVLNAKLIIGRFDGQVAVFTKDVNQPSPDFVSLGEYDATNYKYVEQKKIDFDQISEVTEIPFPAKDMEVISFLIDKNQTYLYLTAIFDSYSSQSSDYSQIWKLDLQNFVPEVLADNREFLKQLESRKDYWYTAAIRQSSDKYLELSLFKGWGMEGDPSETSYKAILDIENKTFIPLGDVGNIIINDASDTVTYQRLAWETEACVNKDSPDCYEGERSFKQLLGKTYTQYMPYALPHLD